MFHVQNKKNFCYWSGLVSGDATSIMLVPGTYRKTNVCDVEQKKEASIWSYLLLQAELDIIAKTKTCSSDEFFFSSFFYRSVKYIGYLISNHITKSMKFVEFDIT